MKNFKNKGFTLIEILLVVGFIALAGIGIYVVYNKVQATNAANVEIRNTQLIHAGIKSLYMTQSNPTYITLSNTLASQSNIVPASMKTTDPADVRNSFGGYISIVPTAIPTPTGSKFAFHIGHRLVPSEVCTKLVTGSERLFAEIYVNDIAVKSLNTANTKLDVARTAELCNRSSNYIVFNSL